jgi:hypothetical protein
VSPVLAPITSTVLFLIPFKEIFHLVRYPNWQSAITGTGRDSSRTISGTEQCHFRYGHSLGPVPKLGSMRVVPFPVWGTAISGTVIHWAPYQKWALCTWSHFQYVALPVPVRSFTGPRTKTGLYTGCPISGTGLCQFRYGHSLGPIPKLGSICVVPFPVQDSASSGTVILWVPYRNWTLCPVGTPAGGFVGLWVCG